MRNRSPLPFIAGTVLALVLIFIVTRLLELRSDSDPVNVALATREATSPASKEQKLVNPKLDAHGLSAAEKAADDRADDGTDDGTEDGTEDGAEDGADEADSKCFEDWRIQMQSNSYVNARRETLKLVVGDWYTQKDAPPKEEATASGKFLEALARANLLQGRDQQPNDDRKAIELLKQTAEQDSENSAPLIYAAIIADRHGDRASAQTFLEEAEKRKHFDSYMTGYASKLYGGVQTPMDYLEAVGAWGQTPLPDYAALSLYLSDHQSKSIAEQLVKNSPTEHDGSPDELHWIPIEYAIGQKQLEKLEPELKIPKMRDLLSSSLNQEIHDDIEHPGRHACAITSVDSLIAKLPKN